ncbi:origin recognition complex 1, putative [Theileria equi strain WA]|uniref:Origin recognition complex subunit 1 n=1 Tax=Theileria equi strain WA TaxID=1537102 RepID=L1LC21_THEEQ|nr:origin recognition complex 1, putative [Theileria equi strain WA]EKX72718.1 origin recognition complex 1, putative [Theileria equi strain WA]|eukprot:XP_004832170.1 origin recognition complex 1, putative [Theileria equi strain WA]
MANKRSTRNNTRRIPKDTHSVRETVDEEASYEEPEDPVPEHRIKRRKNGTAAHASDHENDNTSHYKRIPHGGVVATIDGKQFYHSVEIDGEVISINDSVDILRNSKQNGAIRESNLAKISALYVNENGTLMAEVAFYFDSGEKIPYSKVVGTTKNSKPSHWLGFSHINEVVAFNKFESVEVETFDEKVFVHASFEEYSQEIDSGGDEEINVFCNFICFSENYTVVPFNVKSDWRQVMLESSKYHRVYFPNTISQKDDFDDTLPPELSLQLNTNSHTILGRDEEAEKIRTFMETGIKQGGTGQILYISGVPGTGKTETVKMVSRQLVDKKLKGKLPWFDLIEINAVHLSKPNELYRVFYTKLFGKHAPNEYASYEALESYFSNNKTPCVLIVDEADYIVTKTQKVLFTLFDLPSKKGSKFILLIISNTMDLHTRMRASCVSRLGFGTVTFKPYRYQQIMEVIQHKLGKFSNIDPVALQLCARRVTNYSGDMRKALQICKLAIKEANGRNVTTSDMSRVTNMVLNSAVVDALQYVSTGMKCLLVAIILVLRELELSIAPALPVYNRFRGMITVLKPELEGHVCKDSFKHLLLSSINSGIISLEPTVFPSFTCGDKTKHLKIFDDINEDLGDTGIVILIDIGHLITALAKDPYWERKLQTVI